MRHYRIPVAIAVGLATALAAGATGVAKTTPAVSAKPAAADTPAKLMAEHRGGTLKLLAQGRGRHARPADQLHAAVLAALPARRMTGSSTSRRRRRRGRFKIVPDLAEAIPKPTDGGKTWTFKLRKGIKFSNGKAVDAERRALHRSSASSRCTRPTAGGFYNVHRRRRQVPQDARHLRPLEGASWSTTKASTRDVPPDAAGRRVARQARRAARGDPAGRTRRTRIAGTKPLPGTGAVHVHEATTRTTR